MSVHEGEGCPSRPRFFCRRCGLIVYCDDGPPVIERYERKFTREHKARKCDGVREYRCGVAFMCRPSGQGGAA